MQLPYHRLVRKARQYLHGQRQQSRVARFFLPKRIFSPALWKWQRRSVATGAGWGIACALAPVPMQSIVAALCCLWRRGNVPIGVAACWISFPGYQVIAWPLQWWLGARILSWLGYSSGATLNNIREASTHIPEGWEAMTASLLHIHLPLLVGELLLGCLITCTLLGWLTRQTILLLWRPRHRNRLNGKDTRDARGS